MKPRTPSVRLRFCLTGFAAAGVIAIGLAVAQRSSQSEIPTAARLNLHLVSPSSTKPEPRAAAPLSTKQTPLEADLAHAARLPDPNEREVARDNVFASWAETDPRAAFLHLKSHGSGRANHYRCSLLFRQWAGRDFTAAFDFTDRQPAGPWREDMLGWLALVVAQLSPAEAATMADRDMTPGPVRNETTIVILHQWARTDLSRAVAWADSFPQGPLRDRALDEVAGFMDDVPPHRSPN